MDSSDAGEDAQVEDCRGIGDRDERARATVEQLQARVEELEEELDTARVRISEIEQQLLAKQGGAQGFAVRWASMDYDLAQARKTAARLAVTPVLRRARLWRASVFAVASAGSVISLCAID